MIWVFLPYGGALVKLSLDIAAWRVKVVCLIVYFLPNLSREVSTEQYFYKIFKILSDILLLVLI